MQQVIETHLPHLSRQVKSALCTPWRSGRLALAVDPTLKGDQTTAIVISVVYRGCAIPVACKRGSRTPWWMAAVPKEMTVIVRLRPGHSQSQLSCAQAGCPHSTPSPGLAAAPANCRPATGTPDGYAFWIELGFTPIRRGSPATGWCCRWRRCWPWPMAPGWKTPMTAGLPQATCARRPRRRIPGAATPGAGRYGPSASSATASTGCGGCCSEDGSGAGSGCARTRNPSPTGDCGENLAFPCWQLRFWSNYGPDGRRAPQPPGRDSALAPVASSRTAYPMTGHWARHNLGTGIPVGLAWPT